MTAERGTGPVWVFQCEEFPGAISESRRLADAYRLMPEAISFVADVEPSDVEIDLELQLPGDLMNELTNARSAVRELEKIQAETAALSRSAVRRLVESGLTGTDTATMLGVSPQRVSQLLKQSTSA